MWTQESCATYDANLFDAQIEVERMGLAQFYVSDLAKALGVAATSVFVMVKRGTAPKPDYFAPNDYGSPRAVWLPQTVAQALAHRRG